MAYFTRDFVEFFKELAANNDRDWFHANKKWYEREVKDSFYQLVRDLIDEVGNIEGPLPIEVKHAVFRINRDIRFSKDKSPYKLHVGAVISKGGRKDMQYPGMYIHLSATENYIGGGSYVPDKENLQKIRSKIAGDPKAFRKILNSKTFEKYYPNKLAGEQNKRLPKEFKDLGDDIPELFLKQFHCMSKHEGEDFVTQPKLKQVIMSHYKAVRPLNQFIIDAIS